MAEQAEPEETKVEKVEKSDAIEPAIPHMSFGPTPEGYELTFLSNDKIQITAPEWPKAKPFSIDWYHPFAFQALEYGGGEGSMFIYDNGGVSVDGKQAYRVALFERNVKGFNCWWPVPTKDAQVEDVMPTYAALGRVRCHVGGSPKMTVLREMMISTMVSEYEWDNNGLIINKYDWSNAKTHPIKWLNPFTFLAMDWDDGALFIFAP
eukprot:356033_1